MTEIPTRQREVLEFVTNELANGRPCPTQREIALHFGFASSRAAAIHIEALVHRGALVREPGKARSLRPPKPPLRRQTVEISIFGSIPAGLPEDQAEEAEGCVAVDVEVLQIKPTARTFALRVRGDSMIGKGILDGDLVLLEHGAEPRNGDTVAALVDGQSTLKTFLVKNRKPFLRAENPRYPDLIPASELMVQGVFRALIRKAR